MEGAVEAVAAGAGAGCLVAAGAGCRVVAGAGCLVAAGAGCRVVAGAGCLVAAAGAFLIARLSAAPDRLSVPLWPAERAGALRTFPAGLGVVSVDRESVLEPAARQRFPPDLVWAIALRSADSLASAIDPV